MKFRTDYVTNSSSSSFVCEICGRIESGWDMALRDCEMMECVNGHVFCFDEALETPSKKEMIKVILENEWNIRDEYDWRTHTTITEILSEEDLMELEEWDLFTDFYTEDGYYSIPECMCPICQFIEYSESDLSAYLFKKYGVSRDEVFTEVKSFNKRRKKLYDSEYITYVCNKFNINPAEIVVSWKEEFASYKDFKTWLRG